jgi:hypothetical protein
VFARTHTNHALEASAFDIPRQPNDLLFNSSIAPRSDGSEIRTSPDVVVDNVYFGTIDALWRVGVLGCVLAAAVFDFS